MELRYEIEFFTYWHCGSGLAAGADVDMLVIKDSDGLPFVPGKTIKGLLREAAEDIVSYTGGNDYDKIVRVFGNSEDRNNLSFSNGSVMRQGVAFFSDAVIVGGRKSMIDHNLAEYMYTELSSTAIGPNGVAQPHSLRRIQVALPCVVEGRILNLPDDCVKLIHDSCKYIKRLGQNRNRGLGRCIIRLKD